MTDDEHTSPRLEEMGPEQGGGPPDKLPWTLEVEDEWSADLEHGAALPRIGEELEFIGSDGRRVVYRVTRIVHTVQGSASGRPPVRDEATSPNAVVTDHPPEPPRALRAGLPRVIVTRDPAP